MHPSITRTLLAGVLTSAVTTAQCPDGVYPITLVDSSGSPATTTRSTPAGELPRFDSAAVYLAVPPDLPPGDYLVSLSDSTGVQRLSLIPAVERVYRVQYGTAGQLVTQLGTSPDLPPLGTGLGGVGFGIPLFPFVPPDTGGGAIPCAVFVSFGSWMDFANDQVLPPRRDMFSGRCIGLRSTAAFASGDGTGSGIRGAAFDDLDADGVRDADEPGAAGVTVVLTDPDGAQASTSTDATGAFAFEGLTGGVYQVAAQFDACTTATTPTVQEVVLTGCGSADVEPFGRAPQVRSCDARTSAFWKSREGRRLLFQDRSMLAGLRALPLVDLGGRRFDPWFVLQTSFWLHDWRGRAPIAHSLSVELATMYLNVEAGFVDPNCMVADGALGAMTVADLVGHATLALAQEAHSHRWGHWRRCHRHGNSELLRKFRDALARANQNRAWL